MHRTDNIQSLPAEHASRLNNPVDDNFASTGDNANFKFDPTTQPGYINPADQVNIRTNFSYQCFFTDLKKCRTFLFGLIRFSAISIHICIGN
jgi:hypothetical protein